MALSLAISTAMNSAVLGGAAPLPIVTATNATRTESGIYTVLQFASSGSLTVTGAPLDGVEYLVVAGGGGGGKLITIRSPGGGGAGGLLTNVGGSALSLAATTHTITVGAGGAGGAAAGNSPGSDGSSSSLGSLVTTTGGGGGAWTGVAGNAGGSGGGGARGSFAGGAGTAGQGNDGGAGSPATGSQGRAGGGGGAGGVGATGVDSSIDRTAGGSGVVSAISGVSLTYAAGGTSGLTSEGGALAVSGADGTGNGGAGLGTSSNTTNPGGKGGDGIVIVRYPTANAATHTFTPLDLAPALWLDAADPTTITASLGSVSQWSDKSGNGRNVTQATAAAQPTTGAATINSLNVLDYDGGDILRRTSVAQYASATNGTITTFAVFSIDTAAVHMIVNSDNSTSNRMPQLLRVNVSRLDATRITGGVFTNQTALGTVPTTTTVIAASNIGTASIQCFVNGIGSGATSMTGTNGTFTSLMEIGGYTATTWLLDGKVAEVIVFPSALSNADMNAVGAYLAGKWGTTWSNL